MTAPMTDALGATIKRKSQQDYRRAAVLRDQHGRRWGTQVESETMEPCVAMTPFGWSAPLPAMVPPQKYLITSGTEFGVIVIDYDRWIIDLSDAEREYRDHLLQTARQHFGAAAMRAIDERDPKLKQLAGPPPAATTYLKAMKAGNKWALGILKPDGTRYPMPPWAVDELDSLRAIETYGGTGVDLGADDAALYPDVEDTDAELAIAAADRMAAAAQYADLDELVNPEPSTKRRSRVER